MESILYNISQVVGITIIHSLWQGLLAYIILRAIFAGVPSLSAVKKYNLAVTSIVAVTLCFIYTLYTEVTNYSWVALKPLHVSPLLPYLNLPLTHPKPSDYTIAGYLPYICALYFAGLVGKLLVLGWEWNKLKQIKRSLIAAEQMQQYINTFSKKLNISKHIQLKFSELIDVPCMIGYFKPMILLPVSIATNLSACEIESILLHELSHIKRNDYLVNLLQQTISVMLFFNPFTQLINRIVNQERENGCDDLVIAKTRRPVIYARALLKLEESRKLNLQLALAATGGKFHLLKRIERIMDTKKHMGNMRHLLIAIFLLGGSLSCIAWFNPKIATGDAITSPVKLPAASAVLAPEKSQMNFKSADIKFIPKVDTIKFTPTADTSKHKANTTDTTKKANDTVRVYREITDDADLPDSVRRFYSSPEWRAQMDMLSKQGDEIRKQFDSPKWKAEMQAMKRQGEDMRKQFNSPQWKAQMDAMKKKGEELNKKFNSPEWKKQMLAMQKQGDDIKKQFDSPEWKKQMDDMKMQFNSPEWKKGIEDMKMQFDGPVWKKQMEDIKKQGDELKKQFNSPEWKKGMADMKMQFDSPEWKKQMEDIKKQGEDIRKQFSSPEWKKQMEDMRKEEWILRDSASDDNIYVPKKPAKKVASKPMKKKIAPKPVN